MDLSHLNKIPLFNSVYIRDLENIFAKLNVTERQFKKGEIIALQGELCNRLVILLSGSVKAEMVDPSGKVVKVEDINAPSPLAILFLFGKENRFPVQITAQVDLIAVVITKQSVLKMLGMNETILKNYLDISADFASRLSYKLHFMSFRTIRQKIGVYLLNLSKAQNSDIITLDKTKTALAEYFGVSRQSLERELTNMQNDDLLTSVKKTVIIKDKNKLIQLISF